MRLCRSWLAFGLVSVLSAPLLLRAAVVYKWTDADGVVHFSDQPVPGAEKIVTDSGSSHGILNTAAPGAPFGGHAQGRHTPGLHADLHRLPRRRTRRSRGPKRCMPAAAVDPELQPGGPISISWSLNGSPVAEAAGSTHFTLPGLAARRLHAVGHSDRCRVGSHQERRSRDLQRPAAERLVAPAQIGGLASRPACTPRGR